MCVCVCVYVCLIDFHVLEMKYYRIQIVVLDCHMSRYVSAPFCSTRCIGLLCALDMCSHHIWQSVIFHVLTEENVS